MSDTSSSPDTPLTADAVQSFWSAFATQEEALCQLPAVEFVEQGNALLQQFAPALSLELQDAAAGALRELVLTAHGRVEQFEPLLQLVQAAPALAHHRVTAFRQRTTAAEQLAIRMDDFELSIADLQAALYNDEGRAGLELKFLRPVPMDMVDHARHMAFIMLDHVLGEYDFAVRVGAVDFVEDFEAATPAGVPLASLPAAFDAFLLNPLGRTGQLVAAEHAEWLMLEWEDDQQNPLIMLFNNSANSVATRADLGVTLLLTAHFEDQSGFDAVRDAEEQIADALLVRHAGLLVWAKTRIRSGMRESLFHAADETAARAIIDKAVQDHGISATIERRFDPGWDAYLQYHPPFDA